MCSFLSSTSIEMTGWSITAIISAMIRPSLTIMVSTDAAS